MIKVEKENFPQDWGSGNQTMGGNQNGSKHERIILINKLKRIIIGKAPTFNTRIKFFTLKGQLK